jgi:hypothetical protein
VGPTSATSPSVIGTVPLAPAIRRYLDQLRRAHPDDRRQRARELVDAVWRHPSDRRRQEYIVWLAISLLNDRDRLR